MARAAWARPSNERGYTPLLSPPPPGTPHAIHPTHALTAEVVLVKDQVDEGAADEAERLWDRAMEAVEVERQVLQASEVRADAVRDGALGCGAGRRGCGRRRAREVGWAEEQARWRT